MKTVDAVRNVSCALVIDRQILSITTTTTTKEKCVALRNYGMIVRSCRVSYKEVLSSADREEEVVFGKI